MGVRLSASMLINWCASWIKGNADFLSYIRMYIRVFAITQVNFFADTS